MWWKSASKCLPMGLIQGMVIGSEGSLMLSSRQAPLDHRGLSDPSNKGQDDLHARIFNTLHVHQSIIILPVHSLLVS
jgi:hypothetical protein